MILFIVILVAAVFTFFFTFYEKSVQEKCSHNWKITNFEDLKYKDSYKNIMIERRTNKKCSKCGSLDFSIKVFRGDEAKILEREQKFKALEDGF